MVLISSTKYACETCIKGHRSSTCRHTDRPLFEIKRKGRPVTQCEHCRELRKTKQVHVKCLCEVKEEPPKATSSTFKKKAPSKVPETAAFPNGLPEALEASVTFQEGLSSDSDHAPRCACKSGGNCHCCSRRRTLPKSRKKTDSCHDADDHVDDMSVPNVSTSAATDSPLPPYILARIAELRPVLPKPPTAGPLHNPASGLAHSQPGRHNTHENMFFSPYGRAYEYTHASDNEYDHCQGLALGDFQQTPLPDSDLPSIPNWAPPSSPSACGCGDSCACPGCSQHRGTSSIPPSETFSSCSNPATCAFCLDCTILSLPNSLPPNTSLSISDNFTSQYIDEWARQVSSDLPSTLPDTSDIGSDYVVPPLPTFQISEAGDEFLACEQCGGPCLPGRCKNDESILDAYPTFDDSGGEGEGMLGSVNIGANGFLTTPQLSRSRSSSGSSQSSIHSARLPFGVLSVTAPARGENPFPKPASPTRSGGAIHQDSDGTPGRVSLYDPSWDRMRL